MAIHHRTSSSKEAHKRKGPITWYRNLKSNAQQVVNRQEQKLIKDEKVPDYQVPKLHFLLKILVVIGGLILLEAVLQLL